MYAQLGNIIFEELKGFSNWRQDYKSKYAEHKRINGKSRLEALGEQLENINFGIQLHQDFINPKQAFDELNEARINNEVLSLVLGNGEYINDFVIISISKNHIQTASDGTVILMNLSVSLKEDFNPNKEEREKSIRINDSMNNNPSNVVENIGDFGTKSDATQVTEKIVDAEDQSKTITNVIDEYEQNESKIEKAERKITPALDKMEQAYNDVNEILQEAEDVRQQALNLEYAISLAQDNINAMRAALPIQSPAEIISNNNNLVNSVNNVRDNSGNIFTLKTVRKL